MKPLIIKSRKRPAKVGEDVRNGRELIGYASSVKRIGRNLWAIVIAR